jgi:hypothetical protein
MRIPFPRWAAVTAVTALSLASVLPQSAAAQTAPGSSPACAFDSGFVDLIHYASSDIVGSCLGPPRGNLNGNVEQSTTNGLLYLRPCDDTSAFTDGNVTWLSGPLGIGIRPSADASFDWEPTSPCNPPNVGVHLGPVAPPLATPIPTPLPAPTPPPPPPAEPAQPVCTVPLVTLRNADVSFSDRRGVNYSCADLRHAKLTGVDFSGATLSGVNLDAADLTAANFSNGVHLSFAIMTSVKAASSKQAAGPTFYGADLRHATLAGAKLAYSDFRYADLSNSDLSRAILTGSDFRGADLRSADLSQADLSGANLTGAYLCNANTTSTIVVKAIGLSTCN